MFAWMDQESSVARAIVSIAMAGALLDAAEMLASAGCYADSGILRGLSHRRIRERNRHHLVAALVRLVYSQRVFLSLTAIQLAGATVALAAPHWSPVAGAVVLSVCVLSSFRHRYGTDGSDHMLLIILTAALGYYVVPAPFARRALLWFVAGEALLAYVTAGAAKFRDPAWRAGEALHLISHMDLFGNRTLSKILDRHPRLGPTATLSSPSNACFRSPSWADLACAGSSFSWAFSFTWRLPSRRA